MQPNFPRLLGRPVLAALALFAPLALAVDPRPSFPSLEDAGTGAGMPLHRALEGETATGKNAQGAFSAKKQTDGTFVYMLTDADGRLITSSLTGFGADFSFGDTTRSSTAQAVVRRTVYTEQTTNAQRSFVSSSAADTAAGTGARTVRITYLTEAGAGPFTETLTLNGTTAVNTVASTICFIEQIEVLTVGSGGTNAGLLTLKEGAAGAGATIGTVAVGDGQTFWAHHYVPAGKTANITGVSVSHSGTTVGSGAVFVIKARAVGAAVVDAADIQVTDFVRLYGQSSTFARAYVSPVKVVGPARLILYVTPESSSSFVYRGAIDFFEP